MYMFFWFFKQLYYILRRIFKKSLLLLFIFFIIFILFFVKKTFAMDFEFNNTSYNLPDFTDYNYFFIGYDGSSSFPNHYYLWASTVDDYNCFFKYNTFIQNGRGTSRCYYLSLDGTSWEYQTSVNKNTSLAQFNQYIGSSAPIHQLGTNYNPYYEPNIFLFTNPTITTESSSIINWSFTNLVINCGSVPINSLIELDFNYNNTDYTLNIDNYKSISNNTIILTIPRNILSNYFVVRSGNTITFNLYVRDSSTGPSTVQYYNLGNYTLSLTTQEEDIINEDSNKDLLHNINSSQKETTNAINNLEDNLLDDTIPDDNQFSLPSVEVNDLTSDFFTTLFNNLYNAITNANDTTINITLFSHTYSISSSQFNFLNDSRFTALSTFLQASWYGSIGFYVIYDIRKMIDKIKEGNIENISNDDIQANSV